MALLLQLELEFVVVVVVALENQSGCHAIQALLNVRDEGREGRARALVAFTVLQVAAPCATTGRASMSYWAAWGSGGGEERGGGIGGTAWGNDGGEVFIILDHAWRGGALLEWRYSNSNIE